MLNAKDMLAGETWQQELDTLFARISDHYVVDEEAFVRELIDLLSADEADFKRTADQAAELVREVREMDTAVDSIDELLQQYSLDTHEGLMLMCLAEAMLRIPDKATADGTFVAPVAFEIDGIEALERKQFGPVLHIVRYKAGEIKKVVDSINGRGYGLTFGVHSRNQSFSNEIAKKSRAGNVCVNRNIIGAVVGVQPFGGQGLSGTGPKAGGPHYLLGFATEKTVTENTAALGGNASLLALGDE